MLVMLDLLLCLNALICESIWKYNSLRHSYHVSILGLIISICAEIVSVLTLTDFRIQIRAGKTWNKPRRGDNGKMGRGPTC